MVAPTGGRRLGGARTGRPTARILLIEEISCRNESYLWIDGCWQSASKKLLTHAQGRRRRQVSYNAECSAKDGKGDLHDHATRIPSSSGWRVSTWRTEKPVILTTESRWDVDEFDVSATAS